MKTTRLSLTFGLLAVLLASACAPSLTSPTPAPVSATAGGSAASPTFAATPLEVPPEATLAPTEAAFPVATSRGPNLEATDPSTVMLASGQLQLVEFFRFT